MSTPMIREAPAILLAWTTCYPAKSQKRHEQKYWSVKRRLPNFLRLFCKLEIGLLHCSKSLQAVRWRKEDFSILWVTSHEKLCQIWTKIKNPSLLWTGSKHWWGRYLQLIRWCLVQRPQHWSQALLLQLSIQRQSLHCMAGHFPDQNLL